MKRYALFSFLLLALYATGHFAWERNQQPSDITDAYPDDELVVRAILGKEKYNYNHPLTCYNFEIDSLLKGTTNTLVTGSFGYSANPSLCFPADSIQKYIIPIFPNTSGYYFHEDKTVYAGFKRLEQSSLSQRQQLMGFINTQGIWKLSWIKASSEYQD